MGLTDLVGMIKSVALSSVTSVLMVVLLFRFDGFSRTAFALDGILLLGLIVGSRAAFRLLRNLLPVPHARTGKRVLIFGAGDGGELLCRELLNNNELGYVPVGFLDDDRRKFGSFLHGLRVYAGDQPLEDICRAARIDEVFLSTLHIPVTRFRAIVAECERIGVPVKRMKFEIQRIADEDLGWVLPSGAVTTADLATPPLLPIESPRRPRAVSH